MSWDFRDDRTWKPRSEPGRQEELFVGEIELHSSPDDGSPRAPLHLPSTEAWCAEADAFALCHAASLVQAVDAGAKVDEVFDASFETAERLFDAVLGVGRAREGSRATRQQLEQCLGQIFTLQAGSFQALGDALPPLDVWSFHRVLQRILLVVLFQPQLLGGADRQQLGAMRYSSRHCGRTVDDLYDDCSPAVLFDWNVTTQQGLQTWVCAEEAGPQQLLQLAALYQLHKVVVDDLLNLQETAFPSVHKYGAKDKAYLSIVLPAVRLDAQSRLASARFDRAKKRGDKQPCSRVRVEYARLLIVVADSFVLSFQSRWRRVGAHAGHRERVGPEDSGSGEKRRLFDEVAAQLRKPYSRLRTGGTQWLLYGLLDTVQAELVPVMDASQNRLQYLADEVRAWRPMPSRSDQHSALTEALLSLRSELEWLQRKVRPLARIVRCLGRDLTDTQLERYLQEVWERLEHVMEDLQGAIPEFAGLLDELKLAQTRRQAEVLYLLSVVATYQWVWTLLTGIYGMNFFDEQQKPYVPALGELTADCGWTLFWGVGILLTFGLWAYFRYILD